VFAEILLLAGFRQPGPSRDHVRQNGTYLGTAEPVSPRDRVVLKRSPRQLLHRLGESEEEGFARHRDWSGRSSEGSINARARCAVRTSPSRNCLKTLAWRHPLTAVPLVTAVFLP
jgi:hypothetical protein